MNGFYRTLLRGIHFILRHVAAADNRIAQKLIQPLPVENNMLLPPPMEKDVFFSRIHLITHAGGGLSGLTYLNCEEAYDLYYQAGNRVFEYDVLQTDAGEFILAHEETDGGSIDGRFHPMPLRECIRHLQEHKDTVVIFDCKFADLTLFSETIREKLDAADDMQRVVIQVFNEENICQVRAAGPFRMLFVCMMETNYQHAAALCLRHGIGAVSVSLTAIKATKNWEVLVDHGISVYVYTVNRVKEYSALKNCGISGVFTDFLTPTDLKGENP